MTTIHAVPTGTLQADAQFLPLTLHDDSGAPKRLLARQEELRKALIETGGVGRFEVQIGDDPRLHHAIAQSVEPGATPGAFRHLVVKEVHDTDIVRMQVVIKVTGLPSRLQVIQKRRHILVRARFDAIPDVVKVDLSSVEAGRSLSAADLKLPKGVELLTPPGDVLFQVRKLVDA